MKPEDVDKKKIIRLALEPADLYDQIQKYEYATKV